MGNTRTSIISKNYAKALFDTSDDYSRILNQLQEIEEVLNNSSDLQIVMANTSISISKKIEIVDEIFSKNLDTKVLNFIKILVEKQRFSELSAIRECYETIMSEVSNKKTVEITSPIALNFENRTNVLFKLEHKLNCEILPIWKVDEALIAGLTFKIGDCVIDTSVRSKLENLSKNIIR